VSIDVDGLKARTDIVDVIRAYTPLKKIGAEYCGPCPIHGGDGDNFYVNPQKRLWSCFSRGCHECEEGNDVIGFLRKVEGLSFKEACEKLGASTDWSPVARLSPKAETPPDRITSTPPADAGEPKMRLRDLGEPSKTWAYRGANGALLGYVARYETPQGKQIRCWTWGVRGTEAASWGCYHWNKPRPLYGLDRLAARVGAPVLLVEGEKAADAAQALLEQMVVVTWPGGAEAYKHADLSPLAGRNLLLWPDNDIAGLRVMGNLAPLLADPRSYACRVRTLDPTGMPEGFDAADFVGTAGDLVKWSKPRIKEYHHIVERQQGIPEELPPLEAYADESTPHQDARSVQAPPKVNGKHVAGEVFYRSMADIEAKAISWLWPGRIAKGKVSMIVGNPGLGKSQVCASIASVVSNGSSWPVERTKCDPGSVVILSAEDDPEDTIRPRLEAAGADLSKIFILDAIRVERDDGDGKRGFDLSVDIAKLAALLQELKDTALVIIDPITAYLGDADSHKNAEVRALLAPLAEMAAKQRVAVLAVSHLTKSSGMEALLRVQGSIGFAAAARAVWGVAKDKDNPSRRLFMPLKNNLGTDVSGFAYSVEGIKLPESDIETSHVMWENQVITMTTDEVFGQSDQPPEERESLLEAKMYLRSLLADGPVQTKVIEMDARGAGHSWATLRRAQKELGVVATRADGLGIKGKWCWRLG
jgi:KaiC/GvpD/RAD55 family RecA-like ATPase